MQLHRAVDPGKDQSYVLGVLTQDQLRRSFFPLGASLKSEVRAEAARRGLLVADKPDSHDICFIPNGDTAGFLDRPARRQRPASRRLGGATVGEHGGSHQFTVGQRRGLRLGVPADDGQPALRAGHLPGDQHGHGRPAATALAVRTDHRHPADLDRTAAAGRLVRLAQIRAHGDALPATAAVGPTASR